MSSVNTLPKALFLSPDGKIYPDTLICSGTLLDDLGGKPCPYSYNPHSALQLLRHVLVTKTRQFDDITDRNSLITVTQN